MNKFSKIYAVIGSLPKPGPITKLFIICVVDIIFVIASSNYDDSLYSSK
jgi:hypothetical protein